MTDYVHPNGVSPLRALDGVPGISLPRDFALESADRSLSGEDAVGSKPTAQPAAKTDHVRFPSRDASVYGHAIARMVGSFSGPGFNLIFRPHAHEDPKDNLILPKEDLLELNLTHELWTFPSVKADLGDIPNRVAGRREEKREDVVLQGIPYTQLVRDVSKSSGALKGKRIPVNRLGKSIDKTLREQVQDIHFEPGLLIHVPKSTPVSDQPTLCRMASIPHGTTINAQGPAAAKIDETSAPDIPFSKTASKPFRRTEPKGTSLFDADQFDFGNVKATRLPQDLKPFKENSTMTEEMIQDPNFLLLKHNENKAFSQVIKFKVATTPIQPLEKQACPHLAARAAVNTAIESIEKIEQGAAADVKVKSAVAAAKKKLTEALESVIPPPTVAPAIGSANIAFLDGDLTTNSPNARTGKVESTFWISTGVYTIEVKKTWEPELDPKTKEPKIDPVTKETQFLQLDPVMKDTWVRETVPSFVFPADRSVEAGRYTVEATQIQYSQTVDLFFNGFFWPHISVATIIPVRPVLVNLAKRIGPVG